MATTPSTSNDTITGTSAADRIDALSGNDSINGAGGADLLIGGSGADTLNGGADNGSSDVLQGGSNGDVYIVSANDVVQELGTGGAVDTVIANSRNFTLGANVENLTLRGSFTAPSGRQLGGTGVGNELNNRITGDGADNILQGRDGSDTLTGGGGNDALDGGNGNDVLIGGEGTTRYTLGGGADTAQDSSTRSSDVYTALLLRNATSTITDGGGSGNGGNDLGDTLILLRENTSVGAPSSVIFERSNNDLFVRVDGVSGFQVRIVNHYSGGGQIERVMAGAAGTELVRIPMLSSGQIGRGSAAAGGATRSFADGSATGGSSSLMRLQAQQLVQAMAQFSSASADAGGAISPVAPSTAALTGNALG